MTFQETFATAIKTLLAPITDASIAFVADYDTTRGNERAVTIVPSTIGYKRAGRGMLENRMQFDVVIVKRTTDFATEAEFARVIAITLADQNIEVDGITYLVDELEVETDVEQLESNVFSTVVSVVYRTIATYG